jgi:hypothetical protein
MQKIKSFGGWARESDVVLECIDPTVLPSPGGWQLFGWMTPGGAQYNVTRRKATNGICYPQYSLNVHISIEIEIDIVYNMSRQAGPVAVSRATLLRHT